MDSAQANVLRESLQEKTVGGWAVDGFFGKGKSAVVVKATKDGVTAALKVFHPELIEQYGRQVQLDRIQREKALIGKVHPNLVEILGGGECLITGHLYVAMQPIPFKNIQEVLLHIPGDAIPQLISQLASAARFLEDLGLVHRDIKPENIAISPDFSRAILLDLGVLKPHGFSNLTDINARPFIGTLRYSSPEFLRRKEEQTPEGGRAITFYQIGAVLHDLLMKQPLFGDFGEPYSTLVEAVFNERPQVYGEDTRSVALAKKCLLKDPAARLQLVTWADFDFTPDHMSADLVAIQQRLQARQTYFRADEQPKNSPATETGRIAKQRLEDVANKLLTRVATQLNASQLYPLRKISSERDLFTQSCATIVQFERDPEFGLEHQLIVRFVVKLIDENAGSAMYSAAACWALSDKDVDYELLTPLSVFFTGELGSLLDSTVIDQQLAQALEAAYIEQDKGELGPLENLLILKQL